MVLGRGARVAACAGTIHVRDDIQERHTLPNTEQRSLGSDSIHTVTMSARLGCGWGSQGVAKARAGYLHFGELVVGGRLLLLFV